MENSMIVTQSEIHNEAMNGINFEVLHPQNPLMVRFQKTLKEMLDKRLTGIRNTVSQTGVEIKKIQYESKNISEILYTQKCELQKAEELLYEYNESVSNLIRIKEFSRDEVSNLEKNYNKDTATFTKANKENVELRHTLELQHHVLQELKKYEQSLISNFLIKQNTIEKNRTDKAIKLGEKNKQDYLLMKLENEVFKYKLLIREHKNLLAIKCSDLTELVGKVATKNSHFMDVSQEKQRLIKLWKHVIFLVSNRDDKCSKLRAETECIEISHKMKVAEMNNYKRNAEAEMFRNELVTADKNKKQQALNRLKQKYCELQKRQELLDNELYEVANMVECTQKMKQDVMKIQVEHRRTLTAVEIKLKNLSSKKYDLQECILSQLHSEVISSNASFNLNEDIRKLRKDIAQQESVVEELQQNYTKEIACLEKEEHRYSTDVEILKNTKLDVDSFNNDVFRNEEKLQKLKLQIKQLENSVDLKQKQLFLLEEQPVQDSNLLTKFNDLQEKLKETSKLIEMEKKNWIRKQNEATLMIEKKSQFTTDLNYIQKYVYVLEQKSERLNRNITKVEKNRSNYGKSVSRLFNKILKLNNEYCNQKESEGSLDSETCTVQNVVLEKLKAAETSTVQLLQEIGDLNEKKEMLDKDLLSVQQEDLAWEKKVKLAQEMKENIIKEQSDSGDIGSMKNEIHRMEIRFAQLKTAQNSLMHDLELSVVKRDSIFDNVITTKEKKAQVITMKHQMLVIQTENIKRKNTKLQKKIEDYQVEYTNLCTHRSQIIVNIKNCETKIIVLQDAIQELDGKILEHVFMKQKNLEIIIRKQKFADFFYHLKCGKMKNNYPNELTVEKICGKNRCLQTDLNHVLENLCKDFPSLVNLIIRIMNVLQSVSV